MSRASRCVPKRATLSAVSEIFITIPHAQGAVGGGTCLVPPPTRDAWTYLAETVANFWNPGSVAYSTSNVFTTGKPSTYLLIILTTSG